MGTYAGRVFSRGDRPGETVLRLAPDGGLVGRYTVHEPDGAFDGTLAFLGDERCRVAILRWADRDGTGVLRLVFDPDRGAWGWFTPDASLFWNGCLPRPTS